MGFAGTKSWSKTYFFLKSEVGEEEHAVTNNKKDNKKVYENSKSTYKLRSTYLHKYMY